MSETLRRKGVVGTLGDAIAWLRRNPVLIVIFFLHGLLELLGELLGSVGSLLGLLGFFVLLYIDGLVHVVGKREATGETVDLGRASSTVLGRFLSLIGIAIVYGLAVVVGFVFLILPGVYLAVRLSLAFPACVIDEQNTFESLSTSWSVAKGNLFKLLGISLASFLVVAGAGIVTVLFTGVSDEFYLAFLAVTAVLTAVVSPIVQFAYARVYLENRPDSDSASTAGDRRDDSWESTDGGSRSESEGVHW
ncbi:glycerophosphoryl diester phosphodiesterase membrane domain-containing protein [Natronococcus wangiae]|uniref:glycerophosphoryl diester phosphodiesterase membrane domain-containing protein n=1 Tax=Natronococcus wangiae TaxID=3068275 RepID=UPI00273FC858|nr:glycerophosphoryl diester phosphodiesterase membrane domain-containing protein [Natronococcus sp. AD5]